MVLALVFAYQVELRKLHEFLGMMAMCMERHLQFFEKGYNMLKEMEPLIETSKEMVECRKQKMVAKMVRKFVNLVVTYVATISLVDFYKILK